MPGLNDRVLPHDPAWAAAFVAEAAVVTRALGVLQRLEHIGSTAVPGLRAKPIIDMLGVADPHAVDLHSPALQALGYQAMGEFGVAGRRYFRKTTATGLRTHHLHVFAAGSPHITRHLAFRDYLRAHPARAADYAALKMALVAQGAGWEAYLDGKDGFIKTVQAEALTWCRMP